MSDPVSISAAAWAHLPPGFAVEAARQDQDARWDRGERPTTEEYLSALPRVAASADDCLVLIYGEVMNRTARGERCGQEEYARRFANLATRLADILAVHSVLVGDPSAGRPIDSRPVPPDPPDLPGYTNFRFAGRGSNGVVFRAEPTSGGPAVAVKVLLPSEPSAYTALRLLQEAEILARMRHPNVVRFVSIGEHAGCPYIVTEWADGGTLADRIAGQPQPWRWVARITATIARAVAAAHEVGVLHRDLKPSNMFLTENGEPLVGDFGAARRLLCDGLVSGTGDVIGTPHYMPPEQIEGRHHEMGPTADVYALGAVLYEALTGRPPFVGRSVTDVIRQAFQDIPISPERIAPAIPPVLARVTLRCLAKKPADRFPTVLDLCAAIEAVDR